jgi:hypothetical protein
VTPIALKTKRQVLAHAASTAVIAVLAAAVLFTAALLTAAISAGCGHSRKTSASFAPTTQPFKLSVRTVRSETVYDPETDLQSRASFDTRITHFGRIESVPEPGSSERSTIANWFVYNDSIRFHTEKPYRLEAFMSIDTLFSRSKSSNTAISSETLDSSDSMLVCIFEGPALHIAQSVDHASANIEHLKTGCPGGIYRRLDLPKTYGLFITTVPKAEVPEEVHHDLNTRWNQVKSCPSFSGLGYFPRLRLQYWVTGVEGGVLTVDVRCDTTISNVSAVTPGGEKVDIIANRIQVAGTLRISDSTFWHEGRFEMGEEIQYIRPQLSTDVLTKTCDYEMSLEEL